MSEGNGNSVVYHGPMAFKPVVEAQWKAVKPYAVRAGTPTVVAGYFERQPKGVLVPHWKVNQDISALVDSVFEKADKLDACEGCSLMYDDFVPKFFDGLIDAVEVGCDDFAIDLPEFPESPEQEAYVVDRCDHKPFDEFAKTLSDVAGRLVEYDFARFPNVHYDQCFDLVVAGSLTMLRAAIDLKDLQTVFPYGLKGYHGWNLGHAPIFERYRTFTGNTELATDASGLYAETKGGVLGLLRKGPVDPALIAFETTNGPFLKIGPHLAEAVTFGIHADAEVAQQLTVPLVKRARLFTTIHGGPAAIAQALDFLKVPPGEFKAAERKLFELEVSL